MRPTKKTGTEKSIMTTSTNKNIWLPWWMGILLFALTILRFFYGSYQFEQASFTINVLLSTASLILIIYLPRFTYQKPHPPESNMTLLDRYLVIHLMLGSFGTQILYQLGANIWLLLAFYCYFLVRYLLAMPTQKNRLKFLKSSTEQIIDS